MIFRVLFFISSFTTISAIFMLQCAWLPRKGCPSNRIQFRLYTNSEKTYQELNTENVMKAQFIPDVPIKVILHGYKGSADNPLMESLRSAYLSSKILVPNIIAVHYEEVAKEDCYPILFANRFRIGQCVADLILAIIQKSEIPLERFHLIGFSIGAHFAAQASNYLGKDKKFNRITGLDPAWMFFVPALTSENERLNKNHAKLVDIVHTNTFSFGTPHSDSHLEFYVNGGRKQPNVEKETNLNYHKRAVEYFTQTIDNKLQYSMFKISCNIWLWLFGRCKEDTQPVINIIFGEHAFKPEKKDEGPYVIYTDDTNFIQ